MDTLRNEKSVVPISVFASNSHNVRVCTKANDVISLSLSCTQNCVVNKNHNFSMLLSFVSRQGIVHGTVGAFLVAIF